MVAVSAAKKAYDTIRGDIIEGRYAPGDRITEAEVAATASVSRTPVREALHRLEAEGLIRFVPNQGAFVSSWGEDEAEETFELRARLECYAAELCAVRCDDNDLAILRQLAEQQLRVAEKRPRGFLEKIADLNHRFHEALLNASRSEQLRTALATLANAPLVFQTFREYSPQALERSARHHLELVTALEQRNAGWASGVMRAHIYAARSVFREAHETDGVERDQKSA
ncbi:MAG: GntR family transcriptional regulator [Pseudomonadota bacterium]